MNKKHKEGKDALTIIKFAAIAGIVMAVLCFGAAIWVWSSAITAEATSHQSVYPAESMRDALVGSGVFILIVASISLSSVGKIAKALQGMSTDEADK